MIKKKNNLQDITEAPEISKVKEDATAVIG